jgi:hypothetical protein
MDATADRRQGVSGYAYRNACQSIDRVMTGRLPAIEVKNFSSHEIRGFEIKYCIDDFRYFSHATEWMERGKERMDFRLIHGCLDNSRRDSIYARAIFGMFYRQGSRRGVQRALGERCEDSRHAAHRLVNQAGTDGHDVTAPGLARQLQCALGHVKKARNIGGDVGSVIVIRIAFE